MNIAYVHYNVGSAIEYAGEIFKTWMEEGINPTTDKITVIKEQGQSYQLYPRLLEIKPDIILLNEIFTKSIEAALFYKLTFPATKLFLFAHVWQEVEDALSPNVLEIKPPTGESILDILKLREVIKAHVNHVMVINQRVYGNWKQGNIYNYHYPTNPEVFKSSIPWKDRKKLFCVVGNVLPHKMSLEFVEKIKSTDLSVDCWGSYKHTEKDRKVYWDKVKDTPNIKLMGLKPQLGVPVLLNEYKYLVLPHNGYEPFNWVLLQAIFCGTIPLVVNDRSAKNFDPTWIDWANGLYFGTNTVTELIKNMKTIVDTAPDMTILSEEIVRKGNLTFNYAKMKQHFKVIFKQMLEG